MDLFWVEPWIAVSTRPRGGDWLDEDLSGAAADGVGLLISCLTADEESELDLAGEADAAERAGVRFGRARIVDMSVPGSGVVEAAIALIAAARSEGRRVAVHCWMGRGRSPLVVAAALVADGVEPVDAWQRIAKARGVPVPETLDQGAWLTRFALRSSGGSDSSG